MKTIRANISAIVFLLYFSPSEKSYLQACHLITKSNKGTRCEGKDFRIADRQFPQAGTTVKELALISNYFGWSRPLTTNHQSTTHHQCNHSPTTTLQPPNNHKPPISLKSILISSNDPDHCDFQDDCDLSVYKMIMRQSLYVLEIRGIWLRLLLCMLGPNKGDLLDVTLVYDDGLKKCHRTDMFRRTPPFWMFRWERGGGQCRG